MNVIKALLLLIVAGLLGSAAFVYFGVFDAAADVPHWPIVYNLMETVRQRSIAVRAKDIHVPPLDDPKLIADGAEHYSAMRTGCHLAPGMTDSEIRPGLYPQPPKLAEHARHDPRELFWVIKHDVKMSAMPAWGTTHSDAAIWNMVAFIRKLPQMTPDEYATLTGGNEKEASGHAHSHAHGHEHAHDGEQAHEHSHEGGERADEHSDEDHAHKDAAGDQQAAASSEAPISFDSLKPGAAPLAKAVAKAFQNALRKGDRDAVLATLAADVTISEGSMKQTREEYAAGHLGEDISYLKAAQVKPVFMGSMPMDSTAMVGSESEIRTTADHKVSALRSREMLYLRREGKSWKITSVRWESKPIDGSGNAQ